LIACFQGFPLFSRSPSSEFPLQFFGFLAFLREAETPNKFDSLESFKCEMKNQDDGKEGGSGLECEKLIKSLP
jgi:hypothetical protein